MSPQDILSQLLAADGEEWFLVVTQTGRAEITTGPDGHVVGNIKCHQPEKSSSGDSTTTPQTELAAQSSPECEPLASSSR